MTNSWVARARKFLIAAGTFLVVGTNAWAEGPEWLYPVAAGVGAVLVYVVGNAPKFTDPRRNAGIDVH
jgi:hypothetical protein